MAHEIMDADEKAGTGRFVYVNTARQAVWHGLGSSFTADEKVTATEAVERAGTDYTVIKVPHKVGPIVDPNTGEQYDDIPCHKVDLIRLPMADERAKGKGPIWFNTVGPAYTPLQNREIAEVLDKITDVWPVETHGALGNGDRAFWCLRAGGFRVGNDDVESFVTALDDKKGWGTFKLTVSQQVVVCANTWRANELGAHITANLWHSSTLKSDLDFRIQLIREMQKQQTTIQEACEAIATAKISIADFTRLVLVPLYPEPVKKANRIGIETAPGVDLSAKSVGSKVYAQLMGNGGAAGSGIQAGIIEQERTKERAIKDREGVLATYQAIGPRFQEFEGTAWHAFNAVTEWEDHLKERRGGNFVGAADSLTFGPKANLKADAFDRLLKHSIGKN
jgi:hypothetical protein